MDAWRELSARKWLSSKTAQKATIYSIKNDVRQKNIIQKPTNVQKKNKLVKKKMKENFDHH